MSRDLLPQAVAVVILLVSAIASTATSRQIAQRRDELDLVVSTAGTQGMPAHVALATAALGTFRGLAVDVLWARADHLQKEGQYFEAQTLSQWITALQPRFPRVWAFQSWNLSYNIAAATLVPSERWSWVNRGIELLRTRGIPLNPKSPQLCMDLAWIYHNKIGGKFDREHWFFKARLAREMQEVLGDLTSGRTTPEVLERFRSIAQAADSLDELKAKTPAVNRVLEILTAHDALPDEALLRMVGRLMMDANAVDWTILGKKVVTEGLNLPLMAALRGDPDVAATFFQSLVPFLQKQVLRERYGMDPTTMLALMERYGPLDWRHPDAHSVYWNERGIGVSRELNRKEQLDELTILRLRLHSLMDLLRTGRVEYDPFVDRVDLLPDPRFAVAYEGAMADAIALITSADGVQTGGFGKADEGDLVDGYENFLNLAVIASFLYGNRADCEEFFVKLQRVAENSGKADQPIYADSLENFVMMRIGEVLNVDVSNTRQFIDAMVRRGLSEGLAKGKIDVFNRYVNLAHGAYDKRYSASDPGARHVNKENVLAPFPKLVEESFGTIMKDPAIPVLYRARIWAWTPDDLRLRVYPALHELLTKQAQAASLDAARAFPAPPGYDAESKSGTETPQQDDSDAPAG